MSVQAGIIRDLILLAAAASDKIIVTVNLSALIFSKLLTN